MGRSPGDAGAGAPLQPLRLQGRGVLGRSAGPKRAAATVGWLRHGTGPGSSGRPGEARTASKKAWAFLPRVCGATKRRAAGRGAAPVHATFLGFATCAPPAAGPPTSPRLWKGRATTGILLIARPGAGTTLPQLTTRAVPDGGEWVSTGQERFWDHPLHSANYWTTLGWWQPGTTRHPVQARGG